MKSGEFIHEKILEVVLPDYKQFMFEDVLRPFTRSIRNPISHPRASKSIQGFWQKKCHETSELKWSSQRSPKIRVEVVIKHLITI